MSDRDIILTRTRADGLATLGTLYDGVHFLAHTLELPDRNNTPRISRIPAGRWPLRPRSWGGFYEDYVRRFSWHGPMVEIAPVPGRSAILFHIGNFHRDTKGCVLVGETWGYDTAHDGALKVVGSVAAYERVYPALIDAAEAGRFVTVIDEPKIEGPAIEGAAA